FWRGGLGRKLGLLALAVGVGLGAWGLYQLSGGVVRGINSPTLPPLLRGAAARTPRLPPDVTPVLGAVARAARVGALVLLLLTSFGSILVALYLSGDIDMLLVAPVPMRAVFVVKFFGALLLQYALLLLLLGPALLGYGRGMGYGAAYVFTTLLVL